jgi:hypothetical protein
MDLQELSKRYRALQGENRRLKERIKQLESQTEKKSRVANEKTEEFINDQDQIIKSEIPTEATKSKTIDKQSSPIEKINLFKSLFKGREDVFATRWENSKKGTSGYSPACGNEWVRGICHY